MVNRLFGSRANRTLLLTVVVVVALACGKSASKNGGRAPASGAGESTAGQAGEPGPGGADTGGTSMGGEPSGGAMSGGAPMAGLGGSRAGASSGGSSGAGGSMGGAGSPATPDDCTLTTHLLGGLYCSMEMTCGSDTVLISCQEDGSDWRCGCVRGDVRPDFYYFPDLTGIRTCEVSAVACMHPELLDAEEVCTLTDDATSSYSCTATDTCASAHQVEGVTLETRSKWTASCESCGTHDHACCHCVEDGFPNYTLVASDISDGCLYLDELCRGSGEITPLGGDSCTTFTEQAMPGEFCGVGMACEFPSELADGTELTLAGTLETSCYPIPDTSLGDVTLCTCSDGDYRFVLNVAYDPPGLFLANCIDTNRACAGLVSIEPTGAENCSDYTVENSDMDRYCSRQRRCFQPGTLLGTEVTTVTGTDVSCSRRDDDSWSCYCQDQAWNQESVRIELDASTGSEAACAEAIEVCPMVSKATF